MSVPYLTTEWISAADDLLRRTTIDPPVPEPGFSIETVIADAGDQRSGYVLDFRGAAVSARQRTSDGTSTVRLTQRLAVAVAVARGELSAQAAFLAGDIQVGGDVSTLIGNSGLIALVGDVLAPLRDRTDFGERG